MIRRRRRMQYLLAIVAGGVIQLNGVIQLVNGETGFGLTGLVVGGMVVAVGVVLLVRHDARPPGGDG